MKMYGDVNRTFCTGTVWRMCLKTYLLYSTVHAVLRWYSVTHSFCTTINNSNNSLNYNKLLECKLKKKELGIKKPVMSQFA